MAILSLGAFFGVAACSSTIGFDDPFADYLQRTPLVTTNGGDAQAANLAMQTPTPWPRFSNDTSIPANGARMTAAIKRYESGSSGGDGAAQTSSPGGTPGAGGPNGASTGMTASPSPQPAGY